MKRPENFKDKEINLNILSHIYRNKKLHLKQSKKIRDLYTQSLCIYTYTWNRLFYQFHIIVLSVP